MSTYYPPYKSSSNNIKVELDLSNYATKDDVKNITHVDKIDTDKLKTVPDDLPKLSNVVKNEVVKKLILVLILMSRELNLIQILMH